jgi:hypothetical protein
VRAVKVDEEARKEAGIERSSPEWEEASADEEVFIAQLHRRARLLNSDFQASVLDVIRRRQANVAAEIDLERFFEEDETSIDGPQVAYLLSDNNGSGCQGWWEHGKVGSVVPDCGQSLTATVIFPEVSNPSRLSSGDSRSWHLSQKLREVSESPSDADRDATSRPSRSASNRLPCTAVAPHPSGSSNLREASRRASSPSRMTRQGSIRPDLGLSGDAGQKHGCTDPSRQRSESPSRRVRSNPLQRDLVGSGMSSGWAPVRSTSYGSEPARSRGSQSMSVTVLAAVEVHCVFAGGVASDVSVCPAPTKTAARMREKLAEYLAEGAMWPLTAQILDPVRASVVCHGPAEMLEVAQWFMEIGQPATLDGRKGQSRLQVCRVKNKFALAKEELVSAAAYPCGKGWVGCRGCPLGVFLAEAFTPELARDSFPLLSTSVQMQAWYMSPCPSTFTLRPQRANEGAASESTS